MRGILEPRGNLENQGSLFGIKELSFTHLKSSTTLYIFSKRAMSLWHIPIGRGHQSFLFFPRPNKSHSYMKENKTNKKQTPNQHWKTHKTICIIIIWWCKRILSRKIFSKCAYLDECIFQHISENRCGELKKGEFTEETWLSINPMCVFMVKSCHFKIYINLFTILHVV